MNDNDIIQALERMATNDLYNGDMQTASICLHAKETIERQKAEIERLKECKRIIEYQRDRLDEEIEELHSELRGLNFMRKQIKSEAIKEFAERLKKKIDCDVHTSEGFYFMFSNAVDNLVKEMVGDIG